MCFLLNESLHWVRKSKYLRVSTGCRYPTSECNKHLNTWIEKPSQLIGSGCLYSQVAMGFNPVQKMCKDQVVGGTVGGWRLVI